MQEQRQSTEQRQSDLMTARIAQRLLEVGLTMDRSALFPVREPEAAPFVLSNPYAFALAVALDRGTRADIVWTIPYDMHASLGHLDPHLINLMTEKAVSRLVRSLPRKPRYTNDAPKTIKDLTQIVVEEFNGHASSLWCGRSSSEVKDTFMTVHGVGPGIASMAVLLIETAFGVPFSDVDHAGMDIKPDVHTVRVLYRLGLSVKATDTAAIYAARMVNPAYPGELDAPLWHIGRTWCYATNPACSTCPLGRRCCRVGVLTK